MADHPPHSPRPKPAVAVPGTPVAAYGCPPPFAEQDPAPAQATPRYPTPEQAREHLRSREARALNELRGTVARTLGSITNPIVSIRAPNGVRSEDLDTVIAELQALGWAATLTRHKPGIYVSDENPAVIVVGLPPGPASEGTDQ